MSYNIFKRILTPFRTPLLSSADLVNSEPPPTGIWVDENGEPWVDENGQLWTDE